MKQNNLIFKVLIGVPLLYLAICHIFNLFSVTIMSVINLKNSASLIDDNTYNLLFMVGVISAIIAILTCTAYILIIFGSFKEHIKLITTSFMLLSASVILSLVNIIAQLFMPEASTENASGIVILIITILFYIVMFLAFLMLYRCNPVYSKKSCKMMCMCAVAVFISSVAINICSPLINAYSYSLNLSVASILNDIFNALLLGISLYVYGLKIHPSEKVKTN